MLKIIPPKKFFAKLSKKEALTEDVYKFVFIHEPDAFEFRPGQFVMLEIPSEPKVVQRAYSIGSAPHPTEFELYVKIIADGVGSEFLADLAVGDEASFKAPFGMCCINEEVQNELVLVGTGTGIAPIKAIIDDLISKGDERKMTILFGVRHEVDVFLQEYFEQLAEQNANIDFQLTLSQPADDWTGLSGRVTEHLDQFDFGREDLELYICGSAGMIKSVREHALEQGMAKSNIHIENFG